MKTLRKRLYAKQLGLVYKPIKLSTKGKKVHYIRTKGKYVTGTVLREKDMRYFTEYVQKLAVLVGGK